MRKIFILLFVCCLLPWSAAAAEISVEAVGEISETAYYYARTFDNLVMEFTLSASPSDKLNALTLRNLGSADNHEISELTLYRDDGDGVFEGFGKDIEVARAKHYWDKLWYFDELSENIGPAVKKYFITVTTKSGGESNRSFQLSIEQASDNGDGEFAVGEQGMFFDSSAVAPAASVVSKIFARYRAQSSDVFAPYAVMTNLENGWVVASQNQEILGVSRDQGGSTVERMEVCLDGECAAAENTGENFSTWRYQWNDVAYGEHEVYLKTYDSVGNFGETEKIEVIAQNAIPFYKEEPAPAVERWVKTADNTAVYYVNTEGKRYAYPLQAVWEGYFGNVFSFVKIISATEMATYPLSGNIKFKDGTLIKIPSVPKVYKVENGKLRWVKTEAAAARLFGAAWANQVKDLPEGFFPDYVVGEDLE